MHIILVLKMPFGREQFSVKYEAFFRPDKMVLW